MFVCLAEIYTATKVVISSYLLERFPMWRPWACFSLKTHKRTHDRQTHCTKIDRDKDDREMAEILKGKYSVECRDQQYTYEIREQVTSGGWIWTLSLSPRRCLYINECWNYFVNKKKQNKTTQEVQEDFQHIQISLLFWILFPYRTATPNFVCIFKTCGGCFSMINVLQNKQTNKQARLKYHSTPFL